MHHIDTTDRDVDKHGVGKDGWKDGVPPGESPTQTDAEMQDAFQEELAVAVEEFYGTLEKPRLDQLRDGLLNRQRLVGLATQVAMTPDNSFAGTIHDMRWGADVLGRFMFCGTGGKVQHSQNIFDWTELAADAGFTGILRACVWCNSLNTWLFGGDNEEIQSLTNLYNSMVQRNSGGTAELYAAEWAEARTLAVVAGDSEKIFTSANLSTWTPQANPVSGMSVRALTYSENIDIFVGAGFTGSGAGAARIITSPDGFAPYTQRTEATGGEGLLCACSSPDDDLVVVGGDALLGGAGVWATSINGVDWIDRAVPAGVGVITSVRPGPAGSGSFFFTAAGHNTGHPMVCYAGNNLEMKVLPGLVGGGSLDVSDGGRGVIGVGPTPWATGPLV